MRRTLLIGYGNPGRLDDGLGPALAAAVEELALPGVMVDSDYQLAIEHAERMSGCDRVILADAAVAGPAPFAVTPVRPCPTLGFSTHALEPDELAALAQELFAVECGICTLAIRGYEFNAFGERLSSRARANLECALEFCRLLAREPEQEAPALALRFLEETAPRRRATLAN